MTERAAASASDIIGGSTMLKGYLVGVPEDQVPTPALIVDVRVMQKNIEAMMNHLATTDASLRPHSKTYKSPTIGHILMRAGAVGQCCATVGEAEAMVYAGLDGIFIASEVVGAAKIRRVISLARYADVMVAVDSAENLADLSAAAVDGGVRLGVLVDVDVGMGRCGVRSVEDAVLLAEKAHKAKGIALRGLFGYEGHAVMILDRGKREETGHAANACLMQAVKAVEERGIPVEIVTAAGTGTFDIASRHPGITEIEAGSFVFMDTTYSQLDIPFEQSLSVLSTVLSRPTDDTVILDVGMKGISAERSCPVVRENEALEIQRLSEAHAGGKLTGGGFDPKPGDKLHLVPSHCCTTVSLYDEMVVVRDGTVDAVWPTLARGPY
jgi:D-serine deaminase-like pyridoxal phosphate-dependent protein